MLLWWVDDYLGMFIGPTYWGPKIRHYKMLTDATYVSHLNVQKVCVTITSEAFARLMYVNCRDKWINTFEYKKKNGEKAVIPNTKVDKETVKYQGKWSDTMTGRVKGAGWNPACKKVFNAYISDISDTRSKDEAEGWIKHKLARNLVRERYNITEDAPSKKRKRRKEQSMVAEVEEDEEDIIEIDD